MVPQTVTTVSELRTALRRARSSGQVVGFVPTMGFLHDGHASLMRAARRQTDVVVASIFVNPLQFAADEDLSTYPRDLAHDTQIAGDAGVDILFVPELTEMYPDGPVLTAVKVGELSQKWDGVSRPTHFAGVATVVSKLFNIVGPCRAYFGEKDYQQLAIVCRMVADLSVPVDVVGCPIIRETDGLAMSSRNAYLSPEQRAAAVVLSRALTVGRQMIEAGEDDPGAITDAVAAIVDAEPLARLDYVAVVDPLSLDVPERISEPDAAAGLPSVQLLIAAHLGETRLIDNTAASLPPAPDPAARATMPDRRGARRPWAAPTEAVEIDADKLATTARIEPVAQNG